MNRVVRRWIVIVGVMILLVSAGLAAPAQAVSTAACSRNKVEAQVIAFLNKTRAAGGLSGLRANRLLTKTAQDHSNDMAANGFFDHTGSDGSQVWDRADRNGYGWSVIGENLAFTDGYSLSAQRAYDGWFASPGHHENMFNPEFREIGVAVACRGSEIYYTMVLGAR